MPDDDADATQSLLRELCQLLLERGPGQPVMIMRSVRISTPAGTTRYTVTSLDLLEGASHDDDDDTLPEL